MSFLQSLKNTFLPSEEVSAARRLKVFGTESKAVVGAVIVGAAATAIAAPVIVGALGGRQAVAAGVGRVVAANPGKAAVAGIVGAPLIAGSVVRDPTLVTKAPVELGQFSKDIYDLAKDPSIENARNLIEDSPLLAGATAVVLGGAGIAGTAVAIGNALNNQDITINPTSPTSGGGALPGSDSGSAPAGPALEPYTRETQVIGKEPNSTRAVSRRRKAKKPAPTTRIQILNQNTYIEGS